MDNNVALGPLTTKKRLNEIEDLVEVTKEGAKFYGERPSGFNKGFSMNQLFLIMYLIILL